jgi:predicted PurR-regulated permease PerM
LTVRQAPAQSTHTHSAAGSIAMSLTRQVTFWVVTLAVVVLALWLLREILLPFVAGMALAYLLDPLVNRIEQLGISRLVAAILIAGAFVVAFLILVVLIVPILGGQLTIFIEKLPDYVTRLQALVTDPGRPWLRKIVGESLANVQQSTSELVQQGMVWLASFLRSLWSGGQALISTILIVLGIFLVGQFVEGNVLAPNLVGKRVGLHPVWLIFALFAFGYLLGIVGLLIAVPLAAAVGVLMRFALGRYLASPLYTGRAAESGTPNASRKGPG